MNRTVTFIFTLVFIAFTIAANALAADANLEKIKKNLPQLLDANNHGTEFALGFFPAWREDRPPTYTGSPAIRIFLVSRRETNVKVTIAAKNWTREYKAQPDQVLEVIIPDTIAQMSKKFTDRDLPEPAQVYVGGAIMVTTDEPAICYGVLRYPYTSDGYLALPLSSLGKEYVVAGYNGPTVDPDPAGQFLTSYCAIVGAFNNTRVTFVYGGKADGWAPTSDGDTLTARESATKTLNKGDLWLIPSRGPHPDVTGSYVRSDKPVACFSGNFCAYVPVEKAACDYVIEQDRPTYTWGTKYYVTPIYGRLKNSVLRLFSQDDKTTIYRNGWSEQVCTILKKFGPENEGWVEVRAAEGEPKAVTLLSDKRFNVVQYNPGQQDDNVKIDVFSMAVIPVEQFDHTVMFCTPGKKDGLHFDTNRINIVYQVTEEGEIPNNLEIGSITSLGELVWTPVSQKYDYSPGYKFTDPTTPTPERPFYCKQIKLSEDGVYYIRAKDKFAAYAYGFSSYDSYGFPAFARTVDLEKPDTVRPIFEYTIDCGGYVPDRANAIKKPAYVMDMPEEDKFRSNLASIYFDVNKSFNYIFNYETVIPGEDRFAKWTLEPINPNLDARAVITFTDRAGNDTTIIVEHWGASLDISPKFKDMDRVAIGESKTDTFKIVNINPRFPTKLSMLKLQKGNQGFRINYLFDPEIPITPGDSREFTITFTAARRGEFQDSIGIGDSCSFAYIGFVKAGVDAPNIEVTDATFPTTVVTNKSDPITVAIRNKGNRTLSIRGFKGPNQAAYSTDLSELGISKENPARVEPNDEINFRIWFEPYAATVYLDSIVFISDVMETDPVCIITGKAVNPIISVGNATFKKTAINDGKDSAIITVKNIGSTRLRITGFSGPYESAFTTNLADYSISQFKPKILQQNEEFQFITWFAPTMNKIYTDSIIFFSDARRIDPACKLTGEGWTSISERNGAMGALSAKVLPNPIDSRGGSIEFENPNDGTVEIVLFNSLNQQAAVLHSGWMKAGKHSIRIPAETLPGGAYTYRIINGKKTTVGNFVINK
ncbi:MAG: IgGFc-binding protein [Chloroflexota bacterium]